MKYLLLLLLCIFFINAQFLYSSVIVQDELTKLFSVKAGDVIDGFINLHNPTERQIIVRISQSDYLYNENNENWYIQPGKFERSNAKWITFNNTISIKSQETVQYKFSVNVPANSNLSGSYWSVLFIESNSGLDFSNSENIALNFRYAVQVVTNIVNTGSVDLELKNINLIENNLSMVIYNSGELWFLSDIKIDIYNQYNNFIASYELKDQRVYPGLSKFLQLPVNLEKNSDYTAIIVVNCGNNNLFGHQVNLTAK